jgi:hypothetical protein
MAGDFSLGAMSIGGAMSPKLSSRPGKNRK